LLALKKNNLADVNNRTNRILLVDDEQDITLTFTKGLKQNGFEVDAFNDPEEALSNFKSDWYDLLLLDVRMTKINGFELYKKLRAKDNNAKVCFVTAYEIYYNILKNDYPTLDIGCFIQKPVSIPDLVKHICTELHIPHRSGSI
jgi:two-component system, OmpR family, response regulator ChvI